MKYKYIIYKIYSWKNDTPIGNTILTLAATHFFQVASLLVMIDKFIAPLPWILNIKKSYLFFGAVIYFVCFYFLIYNKKRWTAYIEEYKGESVEQRRKGNIRVISYLIGSILLYFITIPVAYIYGRFR
jgi:uncharacterized membrane protein